MTWTSIRRSSISILFAASILFILLGANLVSAQTGTTSLRGSVIDKSGAAIVGAKVTISNPELSVERTTTSGATGQYEFLLLPPGTYSLSAEKENFRKYIQSSLQLLVNSPTTHDVILQVGSSTQTVEVSAQAVALNT
ncbi:MAG: carboxypeptidase-like regulatory domain-containing protein, partial [Candidatus Acidiferrum sp.]